MKKRIFVIGARGFPGVQGGIENQCSLLYPYLSKKYNITALVIKKKYNEWKNISFKIIPHIPISFLEKITYSFFAVLYTLIKKPHIVHFHSIGSSLFLPLLKIRNIKTVLHYRSQDYRYPKWNVIAKSILLLSEWISIRSADVVISVNKTFKAYLEKKYNKKIIYIPNAVEINTKPKGNIKKYNLKEKEYILSVGRITPEKDYLFLIDTKIKYNIDKDIVIVGGIDDITYYKKLKQKAKNINIIFTGQLSKEELASLFKNTYCFVMTSVKEGMPNVILEAMSFKIPILLRDIPPLKELSLDNKHYFTTKEELYKKLINPPISNYEKYLEEYKVQNIAKKIEKIYTKL